tara:strand:+ start:350 stop:556 length:207 start_codon:yes stop_codon:yes gene_type:complete
MEDLLDLIASDASPSDVSDRIKDVLYAKSAEKIETLKPHVANSFFGEPEELDAQDVSSELEPTEQEEE